MRRAAFIVALLLALLLLIGSVVGVVLSLRTTAAIESRDVSTTTVHQHTHTATTPETTHVHHVAVPSSTSTTTTTVVAPVEPAVTVEPAKVSVGAQHRCWLEGTEHRCVGREYHGELGNGLDLPPLVDVQAGDSRTCALDIHGSVWCWGWDLGTYHGEYVDDAVEPVKVPLPGPASLLAVGLGHECAAVGGQIWCWGNNYDQEIGFYFPRFAPSYEPVLLWEGRHVHELKLGYQFGTAHVGFNGGGCGWVAWGLQPNGDVLSRPV